MRINNTSIIDQVPLSATAAGKTAANPMERQQRAQQAKDSYTKSAASGQVIDAEYVDINSSVSVSFQQERQDLNLTLEPQAGPIQEKKETEQTRNPNISKYQETAVVDTPPGSYLNIFA